MDKEETKIKKNIGYYLFFGFLLLILIPIVYISFAINPECEYKEKILTTPEQFVGARIVFEKDYDAFNNKHDEKCVPTLNSIKYWLADAGVYPEEEKKINKGTSMYFRKIIAETRYGVGTIDSGRGPWFKLVVEDDNGDSYLVDYVYSSAGYISIYKNNKKISPLNENNLEFLYYSSK